MLYRLGKILSVFFFRLFFRLEVKGKDKIPRKEAFILASNHISYLDPVVLGAASPRRIYFLGKEELFKNKLFGYILKNLGVIPLNRYKGDIGAMRIALKLFKEKKALLIFPQGSRGNISVDKVKPGVGFLFRKASVPIVVAKIFGTEKALPKGKKLLRFVKVKVIFDRLNNFRDTDSYKIISCKVLDKIKHLVYH